MPNNNHNTLKMIIGRISKMKYYIIALVAQKGMPIIILPLILSIFDRLDYANYVIFYSFVQIAGTILGLGVPSAIIPFWNLDKSPHNLVSESVRLMIVNSIFFGIMSSLFAGVFSYFEIFDNNIYTMVILLTVFVFIYNINLIFLGVVRCEGRDRTYLTSSIAGGIFLLLGILIIIYLRIELKLSYFIMLNIAAITLSTTILLGSHWKSFYLTRLFARSGASQLFKTARPLALNSLILLVVMSIDKWWAKNFFSPDIFSNYVINYQAAFAMMFVSVAINTYIGPILSQANANRDESKIAAEIYYARIYSFSGSIFASCGLYLYYTFFDIGLTWGYWLLIAALLIEGQNAISSLFVMTRRRFSDLILITSSGLLIYILVLAIAGFLKSEVLLYLGLIANSLAMPAILSNSGFRKKLFSEVDADNDSWHAAHITQEPSDGQ